MAIKIIKKHEPIEVRQVKFTIFGDAGSGKSTFAMTAADCLIFDFDDAGSARALGNVDRIIINHWNEVDDHRREDFAPYKTLGIDTVGGAVDRLSAYLIELDPKLADPLTGGLTQRGYGALRHKFAKWLKRLISYGLDVVLIAHVTEDKNQDARIVRLDVAGQSKNFIHKISDQMGYLSMNEKGERWLNCSPALNTLGKNTAEIPPYQIKSPLVEPDMLAKLITITKDRMNEKQAAKTEDAGRAEKFRELAKEREMGDADFFNALVEEVKGKDVNPYLKRVVKDLAKANGLVWSKAEDKYVISVDKEAETAPAKTDEKPPPQAEVKSVEPIPAESSAPDPTDVEANEHIEEEELTDIMVNDDWRALLETKPPINIRRKFIANAKAKGFIYQHTTDSFIKGAAS